MQSGQIKKLVPDRGFGFITGDDFDGLRGGEKVTFEIERSPKGPRAASVKLA
jgi:cold shock CspA family protein